MGEPLAQVQRGYRLKLYFVSATARAQEGSLSEMSEGVRELQPRGESTRLGAALRRVLADLRGSPPAAVVLLSDGVTTDG